MSSAEEEMKLPDDPIKAVKKTLSRYAVIVNDHAASHNENSDEEYGEIDPTYTATAAKKSLSKYGGNQPQLSPHDKNDSDEDYGEMKPDEFNKVVKKSLSKFVPNTDVVVKPTIEEVQKMATSDDEYGDDIDANYIPTKVVRKTLSRYAVNQGDIIIAPTKTVPSVGMLRVAEESDDEYGGDTEGVGSWD